MNSPLADKHVSSIITHISTYGTISISPGNFTRIWYLSYIHIKLVNHMNISLYFQNFPKISIYKQSCGMIRIRELSLPSEGIPSYWIGNLPLRENTLPPRLQGYNTCL